MCVNVLVMSVDDAPLSQILMNAQIIQAFVQTVLCVWITMASTSVSAMRNAVVSYISLLLHVIAAPVVSILNNSTPKFLGTL